MGGLGVTTLAESWGIKYAGNATHPFQIANGGLLVGYAASVVRHKYCNL
jgi:hypothetical protein